MNEKKITLRQYAAVSFVALFSPISRLIPRASVRAAGASGWVGVFTAIPLLFLLMRMVRRLLRLSPAGTGLAGAFETALGKEPGRYLTLLFGLWLLFYGSFLLRSGGERLVSTVYPDGKVLWFMAAMAALAALAARGELRFAVRCGCVIMLIFACALLLIFIMAIPSVKWEAVLPPTSDRRVFAAALPVADVLTPWVYFSFLRGEVSDGGDTVKKALPGMIATLFGVLVLLITSIGILGVGLSEKLQYPFFVMIKNLRLFHVIERIEALVVMIWMMTDFVCITMVLLSAGRAFQSCFGLKAGKTALPLAALMLLAGSRMAKDPLAFQKLSEQIVPGIHLVNVLLILPLVLAIGLLRNRKAENNQC